MMLQIRDKSLKITFNFAAQNAKPRIDADSEEARRDEMGWDGTADGEGDGRHETGDDATSCCTAGRLSAHCETEAEWQGQEEDHGQQQGQLTCLHRHKHGGRGGSEAEAQAG